MAVGRARIVADETDSTGLRNLRTELRCGSVSVAEDRTLRVGDQLISRTLAAMPVVDNSGSQLGWVEEGGAVGAAIVRIAQCDASGLGRVLTVVDDGGRPDRLAFSPDGRHIAYVSSAASGYASVWIVGTDGAARQLTNLALQPTPGRAPDGFTPPPSSAPRFVGSRLQWQVDGIAYGVAF